MILWEEELLNDREKIFEFLYDFNPDVAERTDNIIETKVENLLEQPLMGVQRDGIRGRLLIIPEVSMIVSYWVKSSNIRIMRVLHQKQKFPAD
ncbi:type II toxin-antitoxin system RelE/ParE family toxin [Oceanospirillum sediminis]|uniref:Type II toxin-antitoxin system RelE/ParE family toxin n=1 Tax=Oceanospirillum sediminis TaxID=2760088 RepID=A0A839IRM5_9GAMM|nr:type II toxin-antitoxin system RelE/ParE family toxin [Oceanospirillum sediminis]MBB1487324.1 type II toxin-antitoxin system RelE/ParE family toxin [Oceanospirillum sediminis]